MTSARSLLERDIERQLRSESKAPAPPIIVTAAPDVGSLLDAIDLHGETCAAWETASQVGSAGTIAQDAALKLFTDNIRRHSPSTELATSSQALAAMGIELGVHDGAVTLEGPITWNYQRDAERAVQYLSNAVGFRALEGQGSLSYVNVASGLKLRPPGTPKERRRASESGRDED